MLDILIALTMRNGDRNRRLCIKEVSMMAKFHLSRHNSHVPFGPSLSLVDFLRQRADAK